MILLHLLNILGSQQLGLLILAQISALLLDRLLGEPKMFHPLIGFGKLIEQVEKWLNAGSASGRKAKGVAGWWLLVMPLTLACGLLMQWLAAWSATVFWLLSTLLLYLAIGLKSLGQHARWVLEPLENEELAEARKKVSWLVSRDTARMDKTRISKACIESVLENGNDAVFGALFWFLLAGAPGAVLYRLTNTLDACWGYRSERFTDFGWWAARTDDWLNLIPARICALAYSLCGNSRNAFASWKRISLWRKNEGRLIGSPNAGIVMASGAGALNLELGGSALSSGTPVNETALAKPVLGHGNSPTSADIHKSFALLKRSLVLFILVQSALYAFLLLAYRIAG